MGQSLIKNHYLTFVKKSAITNEIYKVQMLNDANLM